MEREDLRNEILELMQSKKLEVITYELSCKKLSEYFSWPVLNKIPIKEFAICNGCKALLSTPQYSTTTLQRHLESDAHRKGLDTTTEKQTHIRSVFKFTVQSKEISATTFSNSETLLLFRGPKGSIKSEIGTSYANACCTDILSFDLIEGEGFRKFRQLLLDLGAQKGKLEVDDIFPDESTVRQNYLSNIYNECFAKVQFKLSAITQAGATTDIWSDYYQKRSFICLTLHYFINWKLYQTVAGVMIMDGKKDAINVKNQLIHCAQYYQTVLI